MQIAVTIILLLAAAWGSAALYFDLSPAWLRLPMAALYGIAMLAALFWRESNMGRAVCAGCFLLVLLWWFSLQPSNTRAWQPDVARTAWAEIHGDQVLVHNVRYCDYRTETDYTPRWETRSYNLAQLRGIDLFVTDWGSPYIAHTLLSFQFGDDSRLALSMETRKEAGEAYSAVLGFFRQYELIIVAADERDVVRLRTSFRQGEDVYMYRTMAQPEQARVIFMHYMDSINRLRHQPEWYNALTNNCTTGIRMQTAGAAGGGLMRWDWRILASGLADRMAYDRGLLAGNLPFEELKRRAHINAVALEVPEADFSRRIREGRPGF